MLFECKVTYPDLIDLYNKHLYIPVTVHNRESLFILYISVVVYQLVFCLQAGAILLVQQILCSWWMDHPVLAGPILSWLRISWQGLSNPLPGRWVLMASASEPYSTVILPGL